jgi:hypothetical protein
MGDSLQVLNVSDFLFVVHVCAIAHNLCGVIPLYVQSCKCWMNYVVNK